MQEGDSVSATHEEIAEARMITDDMDNLAVDDDARVSHCADGGFWIQAWLFVPDQYEEDYEE